MAKNLKPKVRSASRGTDGRTKKLNGKTGLIGKPSKQRKRSYGK